LTQLVQINDWKEVLSFLVPWNPLKYNYCFFFSLDADRWLERSFRLVLLRFKYTRKEVSGYTSLQGSEAASGNEVV
jgi:hypothetical protein